MAVLTGQDREYPRHDRSPARVLQQGRVSQPAHDLLIGSTCRLGVQDLGFDSGPVYPHGEVGNRRALGDREEIGALRHPVVGVVKDLVDVRRGDLILDRDVDLVGSDDELVGDDDGGRAGGDIAARRLHHNQTIRQSDGRQDERDSESNQGDQNDASSD